MQKPRPAHTMDKMSRNLSYEENIDLVQWQICAKFTVKLFETNVQIDFNPVFYLDGGKNGENRPKFSCGRGYV